jgi:hypothetical protein
MADMILWYRLLALPGRQLSHVLIFICYFIPTKYRMANWFTTETTQGIRTLEDRTAGLDPLRKCINTLQTRQDISILDVGCAEGLIADWITNGKSNRLVGIEGDKIKIDSAQEIFKDKIAQGTYKILRGDANDLARICAYRAVNDSYDVVLLLAVLQKLRDPMGCLADAVAMAGSYLAIRVPDYWYVEHKDSIDSVMQDWEIMYHIPAKDPDINHHGHLIVYQRPGFDRKVDMIRRELREMSKADYMAKSDYALVSFPKSGRTWIRFFLGRYIELQHGMPMDLEFMPQSYWSQERSDLDFPHIHFTHDWFDLRHSDRANPGIFYKDVLDKKPVIFLLRNPMDTLVSYYYHKVKRESKENPLDLDLRSFILDDRYGLGRYCHWMDQMLDYLASRRDKLIITYELMAKDMANEMNRMFDFMQINGNRNYVAKAVKQSDFTNMQQAEISANRDENTLGIGRLGMRGWDGDTDKLKVRKGKIGSWQDEAALDDIFVTNLINGDDRIKVLFRRLLRHYPASMVTLERFVR